MVSRFRSTMSKLSRAVGDRFGSATLLAQRWSDRGPSLMVLPPGMTPFTG
jgi:hypothetical protein